MFNVCHCVLRKLYTNSNFDVFEAAVRTHAASTVPWNFAAWRQWPCSRAALLSWHCHCLSSLQQAGSIVCNCRVVCIGFILVTGVLEARGKRTHCRCIARCWVNPWSAEHVRPNVPLQPHLHVRKAGYTRVHCLQQCFATAFRGNMSAKRQCAAAKQLHGQVSSAMDHGDAQRIEYRIRRVIQNQQNAMHGCRLISRSTLVGGRQRSHITRVRLPLRKPAWPSHIRSCVERCTRLQAERWVGLPQVVGEAAPEWTLDQIAGLAFGVRWKHHRCWPQARYAEAVPRQ